MNEQNTAEDPLSALLAEFGTKLNELEEKQRLIKDRMLLIGQNLISTRDEHTKEILNLRKDINQINTDIKSIKHLNQKIVNELENFSRKSDHEILQRQFDMFKPLKFTTQKEVRDIVLEELSRFKNSNNLNINNRTEKKWQPLKK